jgi:hypothetical protein
VESKINLTLKALERVGILRKLAGQPKMEGR